MNSRGPSKNVHIIRNFTLTVASCVSVIMPVDFKVVCFNRYFTLTVFVLTRFHCIIILSLHNKSACTQLYNINQQHNKEQNVDTAHYVMMTS